jgi:hypothetical protein
MIRSDGSKKPKTEAGRRFKEWASLFSGKLFVQMIVYADESGTENLNPQKGKGSNPCLCGYIATPDFWAKFCDDWNKVLKDAKVKYFHFRELHKLERVKEGNPYQGWDDDKADDFIFDLASVIGKGTLPVPFGGHDYFKNIKMQNRLKDPYSHAFELFFKDLIVALDEHWPKFEGKVDLFFESNESQNWILPLTKKIEEWQKKDSRIGIPAFPKWDDERHGIPLQAADMFAYASRQNAERLFDTQQPQLHRILDLILFKNLRPKGHHYHYGDMNPLIWEIIIKEFRMHKKLLDMTNVIMGFPKQPYYPLLHHPYFQNKK